MNRLSLAPFALLALTPLLPSCAQPECVDNFDCGIGNTCGGDGQCSARGLTTANVVDAMGSAPGDAIVAFADEPGGASFDGNIGPLPSAGAANLTWSEFASGSVMLRVSVPEHPNAFVILNVADAAVFQEPGQVLLAERGADGLGQWWSQACNYEDTDASYDEPIANVVVDVPAADDQGNVLLEVRIDGEGSDGTALVPWQRPAQR